jgi:hypothetical protein
MSLSVTDDRVRKMGEVQLKLNGIVTQRAQHPALTAVDVSRDGLGRGPYGG